MRTLVLLLLVSPASWAQNNGGEFVALYGGTYSSTDRHKTSDPSTIGPASFLYRWNCRALTGLYQDTYVVNHTSAGRQAHTGNVTVEGQWTILGAGEDAKGKCLAGLRPSWRLDYQANIPVPNTLEYPGLDHQMELTWNRPVVDAGEKVKSVWLLYGGGNVLDDGNGGWARNGIGGVNYFRAFHPGSSRGFELETDYVSASSVAPSSLVVLAAFDTSIGDHWGIRLGSSFGVTPYAPKFGPFLQVSFTGESLHRGKPTASRLDRHLGRRSRIGSRRR